MVAVAILVGQEWTVWVESVFVDPGVFRVQMELVVQRARHAALIPSDVAGLVSQCVAFQMPRILIPIAALRVRGVVRLVAAYRGNLA